MCFSLCFISFLTCPSPYFIYLPLFLLFELFFFPSSFFCILINVFLPSISASSVSSSPLPLSSLHFLHLFFFLIVGLSGSFFPPLQLFLLSSLGILQSSACCCDGWWYVIRLLQTHIRLYTHFHFQQVVKIESP